ncbi:hypothetical protein Glove_334g29 [Diversispora epigaea]|uniref:HMG box domain-containing protein n=1 Tax=Diversispora epigaea TaxID=1348612 RepID=A0A397HI81_9GLOM|nr:hypothetical protein Glove_334g29 [Diversispora epigaea]
MSEQPSNLFFRTYNVQQQNGTCDFIMETFDEIKKGTKKLPRNAKSNQNIVGLIRVPYPPNLKAEDLLKPRNDKCGKVKVPNKFFIYRKWYTMCLNENNMKNDQTSISPQISEQWRNEPQEVKDYYGDLSKRASELFIGKHGKEGIKSKIPKKQKNKKNTEKTTNNKLPDIKPNIKQENLNSTAIFEPPHQQQHLSNNFTACAFPSDQLPSSQLPFSLFQLPLEQSIVLINQPQHPASFVQPSEQSFFQRQESSELSYPSSESSSSEYQTPQSSEQSYDYFPTNNNMDHTNHTNHTNNTNNNMCDYLQEILGNTDVFEGQVNDGTEYDYMFEGQVNDGTEYGLFNEGQVEYQSYYK